jgi:hypothetical protein
VGEDLSRIALTVARALLALAAVAIVFGLFTAAVAVYVAGWPLRRAVRGNPTAARLAAVQSAVIALAGVAAAFRQPR